MKANILSFQAHLVLDTKTNQSKGFAFILYKSPADAVDAYQAMDKKIFQGRLLHIIAGAAKRENKLDEFAIAKLPLKKQLELKRKSSATNSFNWNSMYMNVRLLLVSTLPAFPVLIDEDRCCNFLHGRATGSI